MKPSELPGTRSLYRLTNRALAQIKELWQYCTSKCRSRPSDSSNSFAQNIFPASPISSTASLPIRSGLSSLCASNSPILTSLMPKAPPFALVASVAVTSSSYSPILPQVSYRTPWVRPLSRGSPKAHRPFLGRDSPRLDAGHQLQLRQRVGNQPSLTAKTTGALWLGAARLRRVRRIQLSSRQFPGLPEEDIFGQW